MKAMLICPAFRPAVPCLAETVPLAAAPLFGECLVNVWIEHVASLGARHVIVVAADRPEIVRAAIGDGRRWGVRIELASPHSEPTPPEAAARHRAAGEAGWLPAPHDIVVMNHLPGDDRLLFESYGGWFAALQAWMPRALTPTRVRVSELRPGIWVGSGARIAASAQLHAPCWIGDHVTIGTDAIIGPGVILEDRSVVEAGARVVQSLVGPDTFVGRFTAIEQSLAHGSLLVNWRSESTLHVPDSFLLCSLAELAPLLPGAGAARGTLRSLKNFVSRFFRMNRGRDPNFLAESRSRRAS